MKFTQKKRKRFCFNIRNNTQFSWKFYIVIVRWCGIIPTVHEGSNRAWSGTNQSELGKCQTTYRQMNSGDKTETSRSRALSCALLRHLSSWVRPQRSDTSVEIHTSTQNLLRLWRRSNLKTIRLVYNYFQEKEWMFFPPSDQTIVSLCLFGNKNKTSWTALSATVQTWILLCHQ